MFKPERAEHRLILACAKPLGYKTRTSELFNDASIDWPYVLDLVARHRIAPLLHYFLSTNAHLSVPEEVSSILKTHASEQALTNLFQTQELVKILDLIEGAGLDVMPFKGPALGHYLYDNLGLRPFGDLDILIRRNQFYDVKELLMTHGYDPYRKLDPGEEENFLDTQMGFEFVRKDKQSVIEVHWSFLNTVHAFKMPEEDVWRRKQQLEISGRQVNVFSPAHLLVYLCAHGSKSLWARIRWICDVAELVTKHQDVQFWEEVQLLAKESRSKRMLNTGLRLASVLLDAPLPEKVLRSVRGDQKATHLTADVILSFFAIPKKSRHVINPVTFHLQMHERFRDRLPYYKHLFQLWSAPSTKDKAFVSLPRYLEFLYVLIKPIRMILNRSR